MSRGVRSLVGRSRAEQVGAGRSRSEQVSEVVCDTPGTGGGVAMRELQDRVAVVTGGASGIGRALAHRFVADGMRVVLADVEGEPLAVTVAELEAGGADVVGVQSDVAVAADVEAVRER